MMGIVVVAALAQTLRLEPPRQSRKLGGEPTEPPALAVDHFDPRPSDITLPHRPRWNARSRSPKVSNEALLRNPITGIAGCCARAASGHAAAPPSSVMNSRRLITRSPRRRGRAASAA